MSKPNNIRTPADVLLREFLQKNNLDFAVRRQQIRYTDDNAILIEPPKILVEYKDVIEKQIKERQQTVPDLTVKN